MKSHIYFTIIFLCAGAVGYGDDRSKEKPLAADDEVKPDSPFVERIAALRQQFQAREAVLSGELAVARKAGERGSEARSNAVVAVLINFERDWQVIADKVITLVRRHPTDPAAFDGILLLGGSFDDNLVEIIREHFMNDPRMGQLCVPLSDRTIDSSKGLLREIAAKSPDRQTRGLATYSLGRYSLSLYEQLIADRGHTDPDRERILKLLGETRRKFYKQMIINSKLIGLEREQLLAESRAYFGEVVTDYSDVPSADGTFRLGDKARIELTKIANIPQLKVGKAAPEIIGEDLDGKPLRLRDHRGKVVVLCFWATWCGPCMAMVPFERELVKRMEGKPFVLLGVNSDESVNREKARKAALDERMSWPSFWDGGFGGPIQARYNVDHYPTVYVLDAEGVIRYIDARDKDLDRAVDVLLLELGAGKKSEAVR